MEVFRGYQAFTKPLQGSVIAIGNFDGVHLGHQQVIKTAKREAQQAGAALVVLTFDPHPAKVLAPALAPALLCTPEEKLRQFARLEVEVAVVQPFDPDFAKTSPFDFVETVLIRGLGARVIVVGYDFTFGQKRAGTFEVLRTLCEQSGVMAKRVEAFQVDGMTASSTKIREFLLEGKVQGATLLLGRPFSLSGPVVHGKARGRTIGVPTANVAPREELIPKEGVYACLVQHEGRTYQAVTNVGVAPTFGQQGLTVEAHLLDFQGDLYGRELKVEFIERLRGEQRFSGIEELQKQIGRDIEAARAVLSQSQ